MSEQEDGELQNDWAYFFTGERSQHLANLGISEFEARCIFDVGWKLGRGRGIECGMAAIDTLMEQLG